MDGRVELKLVSKCDSEKASRSGLARWGLVKECGSSYTNAGVIYIYNIYIYNIILKIVNEI